MRMDDKKNKMPIPTSHFLIPKMFFESKSYNSLIQIQTPKLLLPDINFDGIYTNTLIFFTLL